MTTRPVTVEQARRDMRWSVQQADATAEQQRRRRQQIARMIERVETEPARDPILSVDSVYHDRITGPLTPPALIGMEERRRQYDILGLLLEGTP